MDEKNGEKMLKKLKKLETKIENTINMKMMKKKKKTE